MPLPVSTEVVAAVLEVELSVVDSLVLAAKPSVSVSVCTAGEEQATTRSAAQGAAIVAAQVRRPRHSSRISRTVVSGGWFIASLHRTPSLRAHDGRSADGARWSSTRRSRSGRHANAQKGLSKPS